MNVFKKLRAYLRYREAVRKADEAHEKKWRTFLCYGRCKKYNPDYG